MEQQNPTKRPEQPAPGRGGSDLPGKGAPGRKGDLPGQGQPGRTGQNQPGKPGQGESPRRWEEEK